MHPSKWVNLADWADFADGVRGSLRLLRTATRNAFLDQIEGIPSRRRTGNFGRCRGGLPKGGSVSEGRYTPTAFARSTLF